MAQVATQGPKMPGVNHTFNFAYPTLSVNIITLKLWKNIRKDVAGPIWLINTPTFISPLAKTHTDRPEMTQRAQVVIAGSELCNLFSRQLVEWATANVFSGFSKV
jgi:lysyl-tRNA synthetase class II